MMTRELEHTWIKQVMQVELMEMAEYKPDGDVYGLWFYTFEQELKMNSMSKRSVIELSGSQLTIKPILVEYFLREEKERLR